MADCLAICDFPRAGDLLGPDRLARRGTAADGGIRPRTICLHGPESTGKSTLIPQLAAHYSTTFVPEYGRIFAERHGTDFTMADLIEIAQTHDAMTRAVLATGADPLFLDTDPLMTAVWADMLFGTHDPWFDAWTATADLYLLLDIDLPWIDDGTRMFGSDTERQRFFDRSRTELERRRMAYVVIGRSGPARLAAALAAIDATNLGGARSIG